MPLTTVYPAGPFAYCLYLWTSHAFLCIPLAYICWCFVCTIQSHCVLISSGLCGTCYLEFRLCELFFSVVCWDNIVIELACSVLLRFDWTFQNDYFVLPSLGDMHVLSPRIWTAILSCRYRTNTLMFLYFQTEMSNWTYCDIILCQNGKMYRYHEEHES